MEDGWEMRWYRKVDGRLLPEDVDDIVLASVASNRLEGMPTSVEEAEMLWRFVAGKMG